MFVIKQPKNINSTYRKCEQNFNEESATLLI